MVAFWSFPDLNLSADIRFAKSLAAFKSLLFICVTLLLFNLFIFSFLFFKHC